MKNKLSYFLLSVLLTTGLLGQVNVQKASGTNLISGDLTFGSGKTLTAASGSTVDFSGTTFTLPTSLTYSSLQATNSGGISIKNSSGSTVAIFGPGPGMGTSLLGGMTGTTISTSGAITAGTTLADQGGTLAAQRNALAPAQALSFNGTAAYPYANVSAIGSGGYVTAALSFDVPATNPADIRTLWNLSGSSGTLSDGRAFAAYITTAGVLTFRQNGATTSDSRIGSVTSNLVSTYAGTRVKLAIVLSPGAAVCYINGQSVAFTESINGTAPAWGDSLTGTYLYNGSSGSDRVFVGVYGGVYLENRALSAAEVLSVYQTGSFPASDFGASGAPAGTTVTAGAFVAGKKYRILSVGTTSFTAIGASANTVGVEFTATGVGAGTGTALAIGLFVAPDPAQLGSGDYWYDVSGNNATITKPASGVDWVNRWSGTLPGPVAVAGALSSTGNLTAGGNVFVTGNVLNRTNNSGLFTGAGDNFGMAWTGTTGTITANGLAGISVNGTSGAVTVKGTATNDNAATGYIGEYLQASVQSGSAVALTNNTEANVTSISLTAGDWDVSGVMAFVLAGSTTVTYAGGSISTVSAAMAGLGTEAFFAGGGLTYSAAPQYAMPVVRVSIASTTTVYLVAKAGFSVSTCAAFGKITARRVR